MSANRGGDRAYLSNQSPSPHGEGRPTSSNKGGARSLYYNSNQGENNQDNDAYFNQVQKNFAAYKAFMIKKNENLKIQNARKEINKTSGAQVGPIIGTSQGQKQGNNLTGLIKESQEEIMELSQPFKVIFENAVSDVSNQFLEIQTFVNLIVLVLD